jgi:glycosyltransferase involved in cell wall biosynthesis
MHTAPVDENGTDLNAVIDAICPYDVRFTNMKLEQDKLNEIYNLVDCTINLANNEGFGLATAESMMAGTPIMATVTGGLQDQMGFDYNADNYITFGSLHNVRDHGQTKHGEWAQPIWPSAININGSVPTPYIFDDRIDDNNVSNAILESYKLGRKKRKKNGLKGREWAIKNISSKVMCDKLTEGVEITLENFKPRQRFDFYKII